MLAALALGDDLELEPAARDAGATRPALAGGDTIVTRALGLLAQRTGHSGGWRVHIDKHVPVGAGLGGGSADAAAALALANATLPEPLAPEQLIALAARGGLGRPVLRLGAARRRSPAAGASCSSHALWPRPPGSSWPGRESRSALRRSTRTTARPPDAHERVASLAAGPFASADVEQLAALVENDLGAPAEQLCPPQRGVARAAPGARRAWPRA